MNLKKNLLIIFNIIVNFVIMIFTMKLFLFDDLNKTFMSAILIGVVLVLLFFNVFLEPTNKKMAFKTIIITISTILMILLNRFLVQSDLINQNAVIDFKWIVGLSIIAFIVNFLGLFNKEREDFFDEK